jgi:hypothetical protein
MAPIDVVRDGVAAQAASTIRPRTKNARVNADRVPIGHLRVVGTVRRRLNQLTLNTAREALDPRKRGTTLCWRPDVMGTAVLLITIGLAMAFDGTNGS